MYVNANYQKNTHKTSHEINVSYEKNVCDDFGELTVVAFHRKIKKMNSSFSRSVLMIGNIIISPFFIDLRFISFCIYQTSKNCPALL